LKIPEVLRNGATWSAVAIPGAPAFGARDTAQELIAEFWLCGDRIATAFLHHALRRHEMRTGFSSEKRDPRRADAKAACGSERMLKRYLDRNNQSVKNS
jgi:hypothetical protein